jgi:hypothetical protein
LIDWKMVLRKVMERYRNYNSSRKMTKGDSLSSAEKKVVSFQLDKISPADFTPVQFPGDNDEMIKFLHAILFTRKIPF